MSQQLFLQPGLDKLRVAILEQNRPGSVDGLLAHHVLKDNIRFNIDWQVLCNELWIEQHYRAATLDHVAALGYSMWASHVYTMAAKLLEGFERIRERDAFKGEHLSLARNSTRLLGIILGAKSLGDEGKETLAWARTVLEGMQQRGLSKGDPLFPYLYFRAWDTPIPVEAGSDLTLYMLSLQDWFVRHRMTESIPSVQQLESHRQEILFQTATEPRFESAAQAAFIWESVNSTLFQALGAASLSPRHVAAVLNNFEAAMKRWRNDGSSLKNPVKWPIRQEREVQDILWLILRSYFDDVVDEDTLPKLGHSTYRADFGIGSLKLIIEAKFANSKDDFKKIEKEVQEDCIPYLRDLRYEALIVFIYDDSASVQEHDITRRALLEIQGIVDVVIVSRPSQLAINP
jgi:hypothetical protein